MSEAPPPDPSVPRSNGRRGRPALTGVRGASTPVVERATATLKSGSRAAANQLGKLTASLASARNRRAAQRIAHRPDGTPVSPSPAGQRAHRSASGGIVGAVKARWADAVREGRLAAREKETEVRASYERRVRHDAHLHAEQHRRSLDGPTVQPRALPPADSAQPKR